MFFSGIEWLRMSCVVCGPQCEWIYRKGSRVSNNELSACVGGGDEDSLVRTRRRDWLVFHSENVLLLKLAFSSCPVRSSSSVRNWQQSLRGVRSSSKCGKIDNRAEEDYSLCGVESDSFSDFEKPSLNSCCGHCLSVVRTFPSCPPFTFPDDEDVSRFIGNSSSYSFLLLSLVIKVKFFEKCLFRF